MATGATAALFSGTFIRSGLDASKVNIHDVAEELEGKLKGWSNIAKDIAIVGKTREAVPRAIIPIAITYRSDWCKEMGYPKFPDTHTP